MSIVPFSAPSGAPPGAAGGPTSNISTTSANLNVSKSTSSGSNNVSTGLIPASLQGRARQGASVADEAAQGVASRVAGAKSRADEAQRKRTQKRRERLKQQHTAALGSGTAMKTPNGTDGSAGSSAGIAGGRTTRRRRRSRKMMRTGSVCSNIDDSLSSLSDNGGTEGNDDPDDATSFAALEAARQLSLSVAEGGLSWPHVMGRYMRVLLQHVEAVSNAISPDLQNKAAIPGLFSRENATVSARQQQQQQLQQQGHHQVGQQHQGQQQAAATADTPSLEEQAEVHEFLAVLPDLLRTRPQPAMIAHERRLISEALTRHGDGGRGGRNSLTEAEAEAEVVVASSEAGMDQSLTTTTAGRTARTTTTTTTGLKQDMEQDCRDYEEMVANGTLPFSLSLQAIKTRLDVEDEARAAAKPSVNSLLHDSVSYAGSGGSWRTGAGAGAAGGYLAASTGGQAGTPTIADFLAAAQPHLPTLAGPAERPADKRNPSARDAIRAMLSVRGR